MADMSGLEPLPEIENTLDDANPLPQAPENIDDILRLLGSTDTNIPMGDIANNCQFPPGDFNFYQFPSGNNAVGSLEQPYPGIFQNIPGNGFEAPSYPENISYHPVDTPGDSGDRSGSASNQPSPLTVPEFEPEPEPEPGTPAEFDLTGFLANRQPNKRAYTPDNNNTAAPEEAPQPKKQKRTRRKRDEPEPDYSAIIREQMKSTSRTGQACDRCKVKRMKCDSDPMGCAICQFRRKPCQVTDLLTGMTTTRGEMQRMQEKLDGSRYIIMRLNGRIEELEQEVWKYRTILREFGLEYQDDVETEKEPNRTITTNPFDSPTRPTPPSDPYDLVHQHQAQAASPTQSQEDLMMIDDF